MFYSPPADSFNLGVIKMCQTQSIIPAGILSMFQSEKKTNQLICGQTISNSTLSAFVYLELDPLSLFSILSEGVYQNIHRDSHLLRQDMSVSDRW